MDKQEVFALLAAPLDVSKIKTRQQAGRNIRYIDARTVIERLNDVCPGEWHFETQLLSAPSPQNPKWVFLGRLTVLGCVQEDVGMNENEDYFDPPKAAVSDALKRCAVHYGIGIELYGDADPVKEAITPTPKPKQKRKTTKSPTDWTSDEWNYFWAYSRSTLGLTPNQVHEALKVESVKKYNGNMKEALKVLDLFADDLANDNELF